MLPFPCTVSSVLNIICISVAHFVQLMNQYWYITNESLQFSFKFIKFSICVAWFFEFWQIPNGVIHPLDLPYSLGAQQLMIE
jgi:hypothetical protein